MTLPTIPPTFDEQFDLVVAHYGCTLAERHEMRQVAERRTNREAAQVCFRALYDEIVATR